MLQVLSGGTPASQDRGIPSPPLPLISPSHPPPAKTGEPTQPFPTHSSHPYPQLCSDPHKSSGTGYVTGGTPPQEDFLVFYFSTQGRHGFNRIVLNVSCQIVRVYILCIFKSKTFNNISHFTLRNQQHFPSISGLAFSHLY